MINYISDFESDERVHEDRDCNTIWRGPGQQREQQGGHWRHELHAETGQRRLGGNWTKFEIIASVAWVLLLTKFKENVKF